ncbi:hypothetical protein SE17_06630 [Kouleothrix aurantiaca]|uniref:Peptidase S8/S53 domain-containing protein n=1 Tax=Kouleothrix aurantiaca TaxID=186479 RepID=A0A0P9DE33_9CHLR|nr:hypothetical protein SE17_06630 [Kouleothrix aurantiaca]
MQNQQGRAHSRRRKDYFQPGIIRLLVEHPAEISIGQVLEELQKFSFLNETLGQAQLDREQAVSFTHSQNSTRFPENRRPRRDAFTVLPYVLPQLTQYNGRDARELIRRINALNQNILALPDDGAVLLRIASPNWFSVPTPENTGGGGPGSRPIPASVASEFAGSAIDAPGAPYTFTMTALPDFKPRDATRKVDVAMFDTAYCIETLQKAYTDHATAHPIIRSLLEPNGSGGFTNLTVHLAPEIGVKLLAPDEVRVRRHDYNMNDHGLFVSGIIHSIAPKAQLHLYQVLNDYGLGTTQGIALAIKHLAQQREDATERRPLVVNCSFMLVMPLPGQYKNNGDANDQLVSFEVFQKNEEQITPDDLYLLDQFCLDLDWAFDSLRGNDALVIAAAGNDANNGQDVTGGDRPQARFPAAFTSVEGVGALDKNSTVMAEYSNKSDRPSYKGIVTLGGGATTFLDEAGEIFDSKTTPEMGVLGVYLGNFPGDKAPGKELDEDEPYSDEENTTQWAWWSGTSFAAPIITGTAAALLGHGLTPVTVMGAIRAAEPDLASDSAEIFMVTQG